MSDNNIGVATKSNVGFKLQISKEKIEKMQFEKDMQVMEEVIKTTQLNLNIKRFVLLLCCYCISVLFVNCFIYKFFHDSSYSPYFYTIFNLITTIPFLYLIKRNAPIQESDIKKTLDKMKSNSEF